MIATEDMAHHLGWRPVLDLGKARFYQHARFTEAYRRDIERDDGSTETRYACDDDVLATLGDLVDKLNKGETT